MGKESTKIDKVKKIAKEPWCVVAIFFLAYISQAAIDRYLLGGEPVSEVFIWTWSTILAFPQKPLVQLAMIPLAIWMFYQGIKRIEQAEARETQKREQIEAKETEKRQSFERQETDRRTEMFKIETGLAQLRYKYRDLENVHKEIEIVEKHVDLFENRIEGVWSQGWEMPDNSTVDEPTLPQNPAKLFNFKYIDNLPTLPEFRKFSPSFETGQMTSASPIQELCATKKYDPTTENNKVFLRIQQENIANMRSWIVSLRGIYREQEKYLRNLDNSFETRIERYETLRRE